MGEDGDAGTGFRCGGGTGTLRLRKAGSLYLPSVFDGQSLSLSFSFSLPFPFLSCFSRAFVSIMICCAGVSGSLSLVGVSLLFAAVHQLGLSFCEFDGEGEFDTVWEREGGGGSDLVLSIIARTRSSTNFRCSASLVKIRSASFRLLSRSRSASASNSASLGIDPGDRGEMLPTKEPTRWAKLAASCETDEDGDGVLSSHFPCPLKSSSSSEPESASSESIPVVASTTNPFRSGDGGLTDCVRCPSGRLSEAGEVILRCCFWAAGG